MDDSIESVARVRPSERTLQRLCGGLIVAVLVTIAFAPALVACPAIREFGLSPPYVQAEGGQKLVVIPPQYDDLGFFSDGLAAARVGALWGYIDEKNVWVIPPQFEYATGFSEGLAAVRIGGLWGYIDSHGAVVIKPQFRNDFAFGFVSPRERQRWYFDSGVARVRMQSYWALLGRKGEIRTSTGFDEIRDFYEGIASVRIGKKWGFVSSHGRVVVPVQYDAVGIFSGGLAWVKAGDRYGFVNQMGNVSIPIEFEAADNFSEGLAPVRRAGDYGFVDASGSFKITGPFAHAHAFSESLAAVSTKGSDGIEKYGYLNTAGKFVIAPGFKSAGEFRFGRAFVGLVQGGAMINRRGAIVRLSEPSWVLANYVDSRGLWRVCNRDHVCELLDYNARILISYSLASMIWYADGWVVFQILDATGKERFGSIRMDGCRAAGDLAENL